MKNNKAKRYNKGKLRYDLVPAHALKELVKVYTRGAHKYSVYEDPATGTRIKGEDVPPDKIEDIKDCKVVESGEDNWRLGQQWLSSMASVERHIAAWKEGEDIDPDLGTLHLANAAWGLFSLMEFYRIYPEGDNRHLAYIENHKIGLDIDEVICDWVGGWTDRFKLDVPDSWFFDSKILDRFEQMRKDGELDDFYMSLKPRLCSTDIPFEPHCYITSRPVSIDVTKRWIESNGFPNRPVYGVEVGQSKVEAIKKSGIDIFVDDRFDNFVDINKAGVCCYLMDAPHNRRYNVGHKRIYKLSDIMTGEHLTK